MDKAARIKALQEKLARLSQKKFNLEESQKRSSSIRYLIESELEQAEIILAAKDIQNRLQKIAADIAKMQADTLPLSDSIKGTFGPELAAKWESETSSALIDSLSTLRQTKDRVGNAILALEGKEIPEIDNDLAADALDDLDDEEEVADDAESESSDDEIEDMFGGAETGEPLGRTKKESFNNSQRGLFESRTKAEVEKDIAELEDEMDRTNGWDDFPTTRHEANAKLKKLKDELKTVCESKQESFAKIGSRLLIAESTKSLVNWLLETIQPSVAKPEFEQFSAEVQTAASAEPAKIAGWIGQKKYGAGLKAQLTNPFQGLSQADLTESKKKSKPGIDVITRSIMISKDEYNKIKNVDFGYGVNVKFNKQGDEYEVTFKTAKMWSVAKILNKYIDFDTITAQEALDITPHPVAEDTPPLNDTDKKMASQVMSKITSKMATDKNITNKGVSSVMQDLDAKERSTANKIINNIKSKGKQSNKVGDFVAGANDMLNEAVDYKKILSPEAYANATLSDNEEDYISPSNIKEVGFGYSSSSGKYNYKEYTNFSKAQRDAYKLVANGYEIDDVNISRKGPVNLSQIHEIDDSLLSDNPDDYTNPENVAEVLIRYVTKNGRDGEKIFTNFEKANKWYSAAKENGYDINEVSITRKSVKESTNTTEDYLQSKKVALEKSIEKMKASNDCDAAILAKYESILTKTCESLKQFETVTEETLTEMDFETAATRAKEDSKNGYVQHVDDLGDGYFGISDWMSDDTVASFENGRHIGGRDLDEGKIDATSGDLENLFKSHMVKDQKKAEEKADKKEIAEAPKGKKWRLNFTFDDPSGEGTASGNYTVYAPDKERAKSYTLSDIAKKYKNFKIKSINPGKELNEDSEDENGGWIGKVRAHGVMGAKSKSFDKTFKNGKAFLAWMEKNEGNVDVYAVTDESKHPL